MIDHNKLDAVITEDANEKINNATEEKAPVEESSKKPKKGTYRLLATVGYLLMIVFLVAIAPVVCPPVLGYRTYLSGADFSEQISKGSLIYVSEKDVSEIEQGDIVAYSKDNGNLKRLDTIYLVDCPKEQQDKVVGQVVAKTPYIGYLSQLCYTIAGKIVLALMLIVGFVLTMISNKIARKEKKKAFNSEK